MNKSEPEQPKKETPEEIEERRSQSESLYERDMAFMRRMQEDRCRAGKGWCGGF